MTIYLYILLLAGTAIEVVAAALVSMFIQQQISFKNIVIQFVVFTCMVGLLSGTGIFIGNKISTWQPDQTSMWLSASLLFVLTIKLVYDGTRTAVIRQQINPTGMSGILTLAALSGINTFIYSVAMGLSGMSPLAAKWIVPLFFVSIVSASIIGIKQRHLHKFYSDWVLAAISLFCSLLIIYNNRI